jgi:hypothetical protein
MSGPFLISDAARTIDRTTNNIVCSNIDVRGVSRFNSNVMLSNQLLASADDTVLLPGYSWVGDGDTGMYNAGANTIGLATGAAERVRIDSIGRVGINNTNPQYTLDVGGNINFTGNIFVSGVQRTLGDGVIVTATSQFLGNANDGPAAPSYSWTSDTNAGMFHAGTDTIGFSTNSTERMRINSAGNVGIGTTNPTVLLDVAGSGRFTNSITANGATLTGTTSIATLNVTGPATFSGGFTRQVGFRVIRTPLYENIPWPFNSHLFFNWSLYAGTPDVADRGDVVLDLLTDTVEHTNNGYFYNPSSTTLILLVSFQVTIAGVAAATFGARSAQLIVPYPHAITWWSDVQDAKNPYISVLQGTVVCSVPPGDHFYLRCVNSSTSATIARAWISFTAL